MCVPALQQVRERFRDAHIAILARPWVADIYSRETFADEVILYTGGRLRTARQLRKRRFDIALLLQNAFDAALLACLAGIPRRIGYARDGRSLLLTDAIPVPRKGEVPRHERFYYLELLRRAGIIDQLPESSAIRLGAAEQARDAGLAQFASVGLEDVTGISPGAAFGTAKRWLPERFAEAAAALGRPVALFGSSGERALCDQIAADLRTRGLLVHNFAGETSLGEFIELAAACRVYLTNDSGGMHIASALGVPTVAIFGATDDIGTGPTGPLARVVRQHVECSPCLLRECPIDHRCMTAVSAQRVAEVAADLLK
jgi:heptosyltransferase-2